jgi:CHAT domain-containing protein
MELIKIPSASAIRAIRAPAEGADPPMQLALFADPVFDAQDSRVARGGDSSFVSIHPVQASQVRATRGSYARLLYSGREAQRISSLFPQNERFLFSDFKARLDAAAGDKLSQFRIVHFATHSIVDDRDPDLSGVVFSLVAKNGHRIRGYLFLKDIYRMRLHSDLVVLSSCRSAAGGQEAGEGPMSLSRAFLYAGSRAVIASLWEADDEITADLMGRLYRHIVKDGLPPAEALARTQAEFRRHPVKTFRNPYYWAGFELYGDWLARKR